jgi:hypothetical protein
VDKPNAHINAIAIHLHGHKTCDNLRGFITQDRCILDTTRYNLKRVFCKLCNVCSNSYNVFLLSLKVDIWHLRIWGLAVSGCPAFPSIVQNSQFSASIVGILAHYLLGSKLRVNFPTGGFRESTGVNGHVTLRGHETHRKRGTI